MRQGVLGMPLGLPFSLGERREGGVDIMSIPSPRKSCFKRFEGLDGLSRCSCLGLPVSRLGAVGLRLLGFDCRAQ